MTTSKSQSYFETVTGHPVNALWVLRVLPSAALISLFLALVVWKQGNVHACCVALAAGLLVGLVAQTFAIESVEPKQDPQPSDVDDLRLTR